MSEKPASPPTAAGELAAMARQALADIPENLLGISGGDWLREKRRLNRLALEQKFDRIAKERGLKPSPETASPQIVLAIFEAAGDEDRDTLQELWAKLLAAATDPARADSVRRSFIEIVKKLDPLDPLVLIELSNLKALGHVNNEAQAIASRLKKSGDEVVLSLLNLERLDLVAKHPTSSSIEQGRAYVRTTGKELLRALQ